MAVLCTCVCSAAIIGKHLLSAGPDEGIAVTIRILLMAPVYAVQAYIALRQRWEGFNQVLEFLRKAYECVVLVSFLQLQIIQLGGVARALEVLEEEKCVHLPPVRWIVPDTWWRPKKVFLQRSINSVLIYIPVALTIALLVLIAYVSSAGPFLGPEHSKKRVRPDDIPSGSGLLHLTPWAVIQTLCVGVGNVAQVVAMYGLVVLCHAVRQALERHRPILKLLSIKALVFFTVWQAVAVHLAEHLGFFNDFARESVSGWTPRQIAEGLLNVVLCLEMMVLAAVHHCIYPVGEWPRQDNECRIDMRRACHRIRLVLDVRDVCRFRSQLRHATVECAELSTRGNARSGSATVAALAT